jgi:hypothetical protein
MWKTMVHLPTCLQAEANGKDVTARANTLVWKSDTAVWSRSKTNCLAVSIPDWGTQLPKA